MSKHSKLKKNFKHFFSTVLLVVCSFTLQRVQPLIALKNGTPDNLYSSTYPFDIQSSACFLLHTLKI